MAFKEHPNYDQSDADDWLYLRPDDWTELEPGPERTLQDKLRAEKDSLCKIALDRIQFHAGLDYLAEHPCPEVNDFQFCPIDDRGFQIYVEYAFYKHHHENRPESDVWWVNILCAYAYPPFPTGKRESVVTDLGWTIKPTTRSHATSYSWEMICGELTPRLHSSQPLSG